MEEWRRIEELPFDAWVSSNGSVKIGPRARHYRERVISPWKSNTGYMVVQFLITRKRRKFTVHRLVAKAFISNPLQLLSVNHINGVKTDNRAENLEWCTLARNTELQWKTGLIDLRGEKHPSSKLTNAQVEDIREALKIGCSVHHLAINYKVSDSLIYKIRSGQKRVRC